MRWGELCPRVHFFPGPQPLSFSRLTRLPRCAEREIFVDNLLVRVHWIIEMIVVERPCAMGVLNSRFPGVQGVAAGAGGARLLQQDGAAVLSTRQVHPSDCLSCQVTA